MKTTRQIYDQHDRLYRMLGARQQRLCAIADPATGGNLGLVHNWGNDAARAIVADCDRIWRRVDAAYNRLYREAEHRTHGDHFRPLWCDHCQAEKQSRRKYRVAMPRPRYFATIEEASATATEYHRCTGRIVAVETT